MKREFIGGPLDGSEVPIPEEDLVDELHIDMIGLDRKKQVHIYLEDEETGNYKYDGAYSPKDLYE